MSLLSRQGEKTQRESVTRSQPAYISHLTPCKCYINVSQSRFHWSISRKAPQTATRSNVHTNTQKHAYCMFSNSRSPAALHRPQVRTDYISMPAPTCISYLVGTGLLLSFTYLTLQLGLILTNHKRAKHFQKVSCLLAYFSQAGQKNLVL